MDQLVLVYPSYIILKYVLEALLIHANQFYTYPCLQTRHMDKVLCHPIKHGFIWSLIDI